MYMFMRRTVLVEDHIFTCYAVSKPLVSEYERRHDRYSDLCGEIRNLSHGKGDPFFRLEVVAEKVPWWNVEDRLTTDRLMYEALEGGCEKVSIFTNAIPTDLRHFPIRLVSEIPSEIITQGFFSTPEGAGIKRVMNKIETLVGEGRYADAHALAQHFDGVGWMRILLYKRNEKRLL